MMETERTRDRRMLREKRLAYLDRPPPRSPQTSGSPNSVRKLSVLPLGDASNIDNFDLDAKLCASSVAGPMQCDPVIDSTRGYHSRIVRGSLHSHRKPYRLHTLEYGRPQKKSDMEGTLNTTLKYESYQSVRLEIDGREGHSGKAVEAAVKRMSSDYGRKTAVTDEEIPLVVPRGETMHQWHTHDGTRSVATEYNAFAVDSMLKEMGRVQAVKSQLHDELQNNVRKDGSLSDKFDNLISSTKMCSSSGIVCDHHDACSDAGKNNGYEVIARTDLPGRRQCSYSGRQHQNMHCGDEAIIENSQRCSSLSRTNWNKGDVETKWAVDSEASGAGSVVGGGAHSIDDKDVDEMQIGTDARLTQGDDDKSRHCDDEIIPDIQGTETERNMSTMEIHAQEMSREKLADPQEGVVGKEADHISDFNLGDLCAAAKQGDDILREYIKRLTQKILNEKKKDIVESTDHISVGTECRGELQSARNGGEPPLDYERIGASRLGGNIVRMTHEQNKDDVRQVGDAAQKQFQLFSEGKSPTGNLHPNDKPANETHKVRYSCRNSRDHGDMVIPEQPEQFGAHLGQEQICDEGMEVLSILSEEDRNVVQFYDEFEDESLPGFETHRPISRAYSPLKIVSPHGGANGRILPGVDSYEECSRGEDSSCTLNLSSMDTDNLGVYQMNNQAAPNSVAWVDKLCSSDKLRCQAGSEGTGLLNDGWDAQSPWHLRSCQENGDLNDVSISKPGEAYTNTGCLSHPHDVPILSWNGVAYSSPFEDERDVESSPGGSIFGGIKGKSEFQTKRTPQDHRNGVERHHQQERKNTRPEGMPGGDNCETEANLESLKLRLSLGDDLSGRGSSASMLTEITLGETDVASSRSCFDNVCQQNTLDDDNESLLMQRIASFDPSAMKIENPGNGPSEGESRSNFTGQCDGNIRGLEDMNNNQKVSFCATRLDSQPSVLVGSVNGNTSQTAHSGHRALSQAEESLRKNGRPTSASRFGKSLSCSVQYKSHWPQSSSLVPTRPDKLNPRISSLDRQPGKKTRPASAKVLRGAGDAGNAAQRSRPKSAMISKKPLKDPDACGDVLRVRHVGDNGALKASTSTPLTLKLLLESPRDSQHLSIWQLLPDEILLGIFSHLKQHDLVTCALVCQGFRRVAMDESLWRHVHLEKKQLSDFQLTQIGLRHPVSIRLIQCNGQSVTDNGLRNLFRSCVDSLTELNISGCTGTMFSGDSILLHASRCQHLSSVDVSWCNVTDNGLDALTASGNELSSLSLNGCQSVTDSAVRALIDGHGSHLKEFEVFGCINLSPSTLSRIGEVCKNLCNLNIGQCYKITDECMFEVIPTLKALRHLDIRGCKQIRDDSVKRITRRCKLLETLILANCTFISNASMTDIAANIRSLRSLDVSGCKRITNEGVRSVAMCCTRLEAFNLSSTSIDRKSISSLGSYCSQSLRELKLNCCKDITEASIVKLLKHCRKLETLHLYGVKGLRNLGVLKLQYPCIMFE